MESAHGLRSLIHVYGGPGGWRRTPMQMLIDPAYNIAEDTLLKQLKEISKKGWQIGLHSSFDTYKNPTMIEKERKTVETVLSVPITACRQHWLRFSWQKTWQAQQAAGLLSDSTLGFNDRPGFRNGATLTFHPWDYDANAPMQLKAIPLTLMDSHLYDYAQFTETDRTVEVKRWVDEIRNVCGTATLLWHPHTLGSDYGWCKGFESLLDEITIGKI